MGSFLKRLILALVIGGQCHFATAKLPTVVVDAQQNLAYQLDCLSGHIRCTAADFGLRAQIPAAEYEGMLSAWRTARQQRRDSAINAPSNTIPLALPTAASMRSVSSRHVGRTRPTQQDGPDATDPLALQSAILDFFRPQFERQWQRVCEPHLQRLRAEMDWVGHRHELAAVISLSAALFEQSAESLPTVTLIAIDGSSNGTIATLDDATMYVETPVGERAASRLPVIVHEYVHLWMQRLSARQQRQFVNAFIDSDQDCAVAGYHYFDEAIASAIGNGHVERQLTSSDTFAQYLALPESFYADPTIDAITKAILPRVEDYIREGLALDGAFFRHYITTASNVLGTRCNDIRVQLRTGAFALTSDALVPATRIARSELQPTTVFTDVSNGLGFTEELPLLRYPQMSGVLVTTSAGIVDAQMLLPHALQRELRRQAKKHQRLVYAWQRSPHSTIYIVVGNDSNDAAAALLQFVALKQVRFAGLWIPPALPGSSADRAATGD